MSGVQRLGEVERAREHLALSKGEIAAERIEERFALVTRIELRHRNHAAILSRSA